MKHPVEKNTQAVEDLLFTLQKKLLDAIRTEIKDLNCSIAQMELLRHLQETSSLTLSDAARLLRVSKPSASVMVDTMEQKGLVKREVQGHDRRSIAITLTPKSHRVAHAIAEKKKKVIAAQLEKLTAKERAEFSRILTRLLEA